MAIHIYTIRDGKVLEGGSSVSCQAPEVFADYLDDIVKYRLEEVVMASDVPAIHRSIVEHQRRDP
jgi:hypothetical protein